jgi:hypothetical protein
MAAVESVATRAEQNQQAQSSIASTVSIAVATAFAVIDEHDLTSTLPYFKQLVAAAVTRYGQAAASLAVAHYIEARNAAKASGLVAASSALTVAPIAADVPGLTGWLDWATEGLWTPAGATLDEAQRAAVKVTALAKAQGVAEGAVINASRNTTLGAVRRDPVAKGWARVPEAEACPFCLMLAGRGAVYKSESTADFKAHHVRPSGTGGECKCGVEPQFSRTYEPTAQVREAQAVWADSTKGLTGKDAELAFRRAVEKRADSPLRRKPLIVPATRVQVSAEASARIASQLEKALATMRANNVRGRLDRAIAATEQRIAELVA